MLTKWWNWELMLVTKFGSLCPEVTNFGNQNFGYQIWFCIRLFMVWADYWLMDHPELRRTTHQSCRVVRWAKQDFAFSTALYISKLSFTGSDYGLSLAQHQAIIWTNDGILSIRTVGTNSSEILSEIHHFHSRNCQYCKCCLQHGSNFVLASMC